MGLSPRLLRPANNAFTPKSIPGLIGWWDFSDASTLGPSSSGTGTVSNNGPIKYVADKSQASAAMIQTGADSVAPTYLTSAQNNLSAAGFDGGDSMISTFTRTLSSETVFAIARMASASQSNARLFTQSDAGNDFGITGHYIPLQREASSESISSYALGGGRAAVSVTYDTWFLACSRHTGSEIQNRINNGNAATYSHTLNKEFTRFGIGEGLPSFGTRWQSRIAEIVLFSRSLTDSEMNAVARWLGKKWNITVA